MFCANLILQDGNCRGQCRRGVALHRPIFAVVDVRVVLPEAIGTHSMGEVSLTVLMDVRLHLNPRVGLSSDLLAVGADWQNTAEDFDLIQDVLNFLFASSKDQIA